MDLVWLIDLVGESEAAALFGLGIGAIFGWAAQRSRFCLRASVVEFARGSLGPRVTVWLLTFSTALFWTQGLVIWEVISLEETRVLALPGSISGSILGGAMFGVGMVLARGCSGRLLVLAATGNLRALISGLVFAVVAQISLHGAFSSLRTELAGMRLTQGLGPDLLSMAEVDARVGLAVAVLFTAGALALAWWNRVGVRVLLFGCAVGFSVAAGWCATYWLSQSSFDPVAVKSLTFSGPSADTLMFLLSAAPAFDFDIGLIPGVALGAFLAAAVHGELEWQGWSGARSMHRYLVGAALMGFGAMLAGGCAIGAGVTGASTFALTMWIALTAMWTAGALTDLLFDRDGQPAGRAGRAVPPIPEAF